MKICRSCKIEKSLDEFYKKRGSCKACVNVRVAVYNASHLVELSKTKKVWYHLHKDRQYELARERCRKDPTRIKEKLFAFAWPHIARIVTHGLPEWYKEQLLKKQFERETPNA